MTATRSERPDEFVQSLARGLLVIRTLTSSEPLTLSDAARRAGFSRAAARRFLITLGHVGYVHASGGRFASAPRVLELGSAYLSSLTLPEIAGPHLERLVRKVDESSSDSVLDGADVVHLGACPREQS